MIYYKKYMNLKKIMKQINYNAGIILKNMKWKIEILMSLYITIK